MDNHKQKPKISVCIPVYNAELWLAEAIESIESQTFEDWEIIVVDDGSTDSTKNLLSYFSEKLGNKFTAAYSVNSGIAETRNQANLFAKGEIIVVQDADDYSHPQRLEKTWKFFKRHKNIDLIYGSYQTMDIFGKPVTQYDSEEFDQKRLLEHNYIAHPTVAYRREGRIKYRPECKVLDDWFLYLDYIKAGKKIAKMDDVLSFYRQLPTGVSQSKLKEVEEMRSKFLKEASEYSNSMRY